MNGTAKIADRNKFGSKTRMSTLLKWAQNTQGKLSSNKNSNSSEKKWIHSPESLQKGHIAYLVKFLGNTMVDEPKGIEVIKEAIRKLRFSQQLRKSETGAKTKKVELTVSVDGVAIQEPRSHNILHQFPLHQISYCADDKGEKNFFSFIAKQQSQDGDAEDKHECFVFISEKLAEEITLTIGQAFELAYKRFLETSGKDLEAQRRAMIVQQKIKKLEQDVKVYRQRLQDISQFPGIKPELDQYLKRKQLRNILEIGGSVNNNDSIQDQSSSKKETHEFLDLNDMNGSAPTVPQVPPREPPTVGTRLEGLLLNELEHDNDFDPRSFENNTNFPSSPPPLIAPPPKPAKRNNISINLNNDLSIPSQITPSTPSITTPTSATSAKILDPFEMGDFSTTSATPQDIENAIGLLDKRIMEMKTGFSRGISFGNDDFSLDNLDPLKN
ncbi:PTB domain-containing adapter protein ced-6 isoform X1 [Sitophilus oryzae]|uniref:PTB domain-containing adapter protein ced-6 isoform X1 n=2 Tax=Sitophilus oryzae TaxID=7048 RepID=A0A6J2YQS8_SITOR|nr:PTB domain-containing adapter protein ced-6 isoform X1 [Sitophilus oryzae]